MNKVVIREAMAEVVTSWIKWQRAKAAKKGFSTRQKKEFQAAIEYMCEVMLFVAPDHPSKIWREAWRVMEQYLTTGRVTSRAMLRLINAYHIGL